MREPPAGGEKSAREREAALRLLCLTVPVLALGAYGISAPVLGTMPFAAVFALAIAVALFVRDFERGARVSRALPMVVCAFAILLLVDFKNFPEKGLSAFCVSDVHFPDSFRVAGERWLSAGTLIFCGAFFFLLQERSSHQDVRFQPSEYRVWPRVLRELWAGNLLFSLGVFEAALVGLCVLGWLSERVLALSNLEMLGAVQRSWASRAAIALPVLLASPLLLMAVRDAFRTLFDPELGRLFGTGALARGLSGGLSPRPGRADGVRRLRPLSEPGLLSDAGGTDLSETSIRRLQAASQARRIAGHAGHGSRKRDLLRRSQRAFVRHAGTRVRLVDGER
ncbi:MAG: hypothetical protein WDO74_19755 [Pseudomonadota bacterium]